MHVVCASGRARACMRVHLRTKENGVLALVPLTNTHELYHELAMQLRSWHLLHAFLQCGKVLCKQLSCLSSSLPPSLHATGCSIFSQKVICKTGWLKPTVRN